MGSEGTLALIVGLELRLAPAMPGDGSVLGAFASLDDGGRRRGAAHASAGAVACELLDRTFLDVARSGGAPVPVRRRREAVLLAEVEGATRADVDGAGARAWRRASAARARRT